MGGGGLEYTMRHAREHCGLLKGMHVCILRALARATAMAYITIRVHRGPRALSSPVCNPQEPRQPIKKKLKRRNYSAAHGVLDVLPR